MSKELNTCPFCSNKKVVIAAVERPSQNFAVWCINCNTHTSYFKSREDAINAWNTQAEVKNETQA